MADSILIIGTRDIASALGIGRNRLLAWLADPEMNIPISNQLIPGRWVAARQSLIDWSNGYFSQEKFQKNIRSRGAPSRKRRRKKIFSLN